MAASKGYEQNGDAWLPISQCLHHTITSACCKKRLERWNIEDIPTFSHPVQKDSLWLRIFL